MIAIAPFRRKLLLETKKCIDGSDPRRYTSCIGEIFTPSGMFPKGFIEFESSNENIILHPSFIINLESHMENDYAGNVSIENDLKVQVPLYKYEGFNEYTRLLSASKVVKFYAINENNSIKSIDSYCVNNYSMTITPRHHEIDSIIGGLPTKHIIKGPEDVEFYFNLHRSEKNNR